ncbi:hypothetical protein OROGR_003573 [Orobanche gracilis]
MESQLGFAENSFDSRYTRRVGEALNELPDCFTITDPCISGHPIVFASNGFLKMVGYSKDEVIGKNGRIFQGPGTDRRSVMAIREGKAVQLSLLNYKRDGKPFWMLFQLRPVFSKEDGRAINFVGVQVPILRKIRMSGYEMRLCEDGGDNGNVVLRCCRREVCLELRGLSSPESVSSDHDRGIKDCVRRHQACTVCILNYRLMTDCLLLIISLELLIFRTNVSWFAACKKIELPFGTFFTFPRCGMLQERMEEQCNNRETHALKPEIRQLSMVGAVKAALRGLTMGPN